MKSKFKFSLKHLYLLLTIFILFVFCNANIASTKPFGFGFAFALVANNFYSIVIIVFYFVAAIIQNLTFNGLIDVCLVCALLIIFYILQKTTQRQSLILMLLLCAFSRVANIYFSFTNIQSILFSILDLVVGIGFCFVSYKFVYTILKRGIQCLTTVEKSFACIMLSALFCGLTNLVFGISISKLLFVLILLISSLCLGTKTVFLACFIAIAHILSGLNLFSGLTYFVLACVASLLSPHNKYLSACAICLTDVLIGLFTNYAWLDLLPVCIASIIFICIPKKYIQKLGDYVIGSKIHLIGTYYIARKQENIKNQLANMAELFKQMQKCYRDLLIGQNNQAKVAQLYAQELKLSMCENCINHVACQNINISPCFEELINRAQTRGKVNLLDVPPLLTSNCTKINALISNVNQLASEYEKKLRESQAQDENKLNISLQLGGTSKIFSQLSTQFANLDKTNAKKSQLIKECLQTKNIVCKECVAAEDENGVKEIFFIVRNFDVVNPEILKVCEKYYNCKFEQKLCFQTKVAGWSFLSTVPCNRYELVCGYASRPKDVSKPNGDNYVYSKLTSNKFLIAICDGMGHGAHANTISGLAINLIESYYKCGLSSQIVLDSVNSILLPVSEQGFSTLDACIVDTISGDVDFIKIGSSISVVKQSQKSNIVNVESLPLGVVENVVPTTYKATLFAGDVVVLASDGVVDVFNSHEDFCNFVNNENIINMQLFAESILEEAIARKAVHTDDMTVIAYRLIQKQ